MRVFDLSNIDLYNTVYLPLLHDDRRFHILYGGRDSGKSDFVAQSAIIEMLEKEYFRGIIIRNRYVNIKGSQFQTLVDQIAQWQLHEYFHVTTSPIQIVCKLNNNMIIARGLDQPDKAKSIKDPTWTWYEEATQINKDSFIQTSLSMRTSRTARLREYLTFNPDNANSWINGHFFPEKQFYEKEDGQFNWVKSTNPNAVILHTTYKDNRFCRPERQALLENLKNTDTNYYRVNTLGLWGGALKGLIYPQWDAVDEFPESGDDVFALDYGFNNPTALLRACYYENQLYIDELAYVTNHTHQDVVKLLVSDFKELIGRKIIIVDSAVPELITQLIRAGFNARSSEKGPGSVVKGIQLVKEYPLCITSHSSNIFNEIAKYVWKEMPSGATIDEPVKVDDHLMDAMRYIIQSYGQYKWKKNITTTSSRIREPKRRKLITGF